MLWVHSRHGALRQHSFLRLRAFVFRARSIVKASSRRRSLVPGPSECFHAASDLARNQDALLRPILPILSGVDAFALQRIQHSSAHWSRRCIILRGDIETRTRARSASVISRGRDDQGRRLIRLTFSEQLLPVQVLLDLQRQLLFNLLQFLELCLVL